MTWLSLSLPCEPCFSESLLSFNQWKMAIFFFLFLIFFLLGVEQINAILSWVCAVNSDEHRQSIRTTHGYPDSPTGRKSLENCVIKKHTHIFLLQNRNTESGITETSANPGGGYNYPSLQWLKGMNAQIEGVTQLSPCHTGHRGLLSDCPFPFAKGKFLPSWLRHTTTPSAHPKSISLPAKGSILSCCLVGTFEFLLYVNPDPNLPAG